MQQQSESQQQQPQQQQNQQLDLFGMESTDTSSLQISSAPSQTSKSMFILDQGKVTKGHQRSQKVNKVAQRSTTIFYKTLIEYIIVK